MFGMIGRRIALAVLTLALTSVITSVVVQVLPGDACTAFLGRYLEPDALAQCRDQLRLDEPPVERYFGWAGGVLTGDLGSSLSTRHPIVDVLVPRIRNSFVLGGLAALIGLPLAIGLGIFAAVRRDRRGDLLASGIAMAAMAMPEFVVATLLIFVFAIGLGWLPAVTLAATNAGIGTLLPSMVLPVATLVVVPIAHVLRITRTNVIDQLDSPHAEFARLRGVSGARLLRRHVLPGALPATVSLCAMTLAWLLCGVVVVERVFNFPGLGSLMVQAINDRDIPLVQAVTMVFAATYVAANLIADCIAVAFNPRLRRRAA